MNVLVTGATGYIGSAIVRALQAAGHTVTGLVRSEAAARKLEALGVCPVSGDLHQPQTLAQAAQPVDAVIHAASTGDEQMASAEKAAVETFLETLAGTGKPFIYTTGTWLLGNTGDCLADEHTPLDPTPLIAWRAELEAQVLAAQDRQIRTIVIVDAVGVTKSLKTDTRALERKPTAAIKDLMMGVMMGAKDEDTFLSLAGRLTRLERQLTAKEQGKLQELAGGKSVKEIAGALLDVYDPDVILDKAIADHGLTAAETPTEGQLETAQKALIRSAAAIFTGELVEYVDNVRKIHEQIIDTVNIDRVTFAGWDQQAKDQAQSVITKRWQRKARTGERWAHQRESMNW